MHLVPILVALALGADPVAFVAVAPGYPGTTVEAQASMDAFALALAAQAGWPTGSVTAAYYEKDGPGLERLAKPDAALAMVALPLFLQQADALRLEARLVAAQKGAGPTEVWALVARKGRLGSPGALAGWQVNSIAGYAPAFVKGPALGGWGPVPASATRCSRRSGRPPPERTSPSCSMEPRPPPCPRCPSPPTWRWWPGLHRSRAAFS